MAQYKVKATIAVKFDVEYFGEMAKALEGAENSILTALSRLKFLSSCRFKEVEVQMEDY